MNPETATHSQSPCDEHTEQTMEIENGNFNNNGIDFLQKDVEPKVGYTCFRNDSEYICDPPVEDCSSNQKTAHENLKNELTSNTAVLESRDLSVSANVDSGRTSANKQENRDHTSSSNLVITQNSYNQSLENQGISTEHSLPDVQGARIVPSVSCKSQKVATARQSEAFSEDLLVVLSIVEEDMRQHSLRTAPTAENKKNQAVTNGADNSVASEDEYDSSLDSSSSSSESSSDDSDSDSSVDGRNTRSKMQEEKIYDTGPYKTKDELALSDLPNVDPLNLFVDETIEIAPLGKIESVIYGEALVIIKSFELVPAVDADTILLLENRSGFGKVFDIFGQVKSPHYCVRFNNDEEIKSTKVEVGQTVYYAPKAKDATHFVFVSEFKNVKGSDASWKHDQEPPETLLDFSDDEAEAKAKAERRKASQLKKRNEGHFQEQETTIETKEQTSSRKTSKHPQTTMQQPSQVVIPSSEQQSHVVFEPFQHPPALRIPPASLRHQIPLRPHATGGRCQPFLSPPEGPHFDQQFHPHAVHRFAFEPRYGPSHGNVMIPERPSEYTHGHFGPGNEVFRPPFQNMVPLPPLGGQYWCGASHNVGMGPRVFSDGGSGEPNTMAPHATTPYSHQQASHDVIQGSPSTKKQPLMNGSNALPNRPPMNLWYVDQTHTGVRQSPPPLMQQQPSFPPFMKREHAHNVRVGLPHLGTRLSVTQAKASPCTHPMNLHRWPVSQGSATEHSSRQVPAAEQPPQCTIETERCQNVGKTREPPKKVREYLDT